MSMTIPRKNRRRGSVESPSFSRMTIPQRNRRRGSVESPSFPLFFKPVAMADESTGVRLLYFLLRTFLGAMMRFFESSTTLRV
jgi:hypothetical protein